MKYIFVLLLAAPALTYAADGSLQAFLSGIGGFFNTAVIPFMLSIAFFMFVYNAIRFFVFQGDSDDGHEHAKMLTIYSIGTFVFILSFWGIVNIVSDGFGLNINPCEDYKSSDYLTRYDTPCEADPGGVGPS